MLKLAFRNIFRQRARTALTLAAIAFGVTGLVISRGFLDDMLVQLAEVIVHSQSGHIQISRAGFSELGWRSPERYLIEAPPTLRRIAAASPYVDSVMARVGFSGLLGNGKADRPIIGEGIEPGLEAKLGTLMRIVAGRALTDDDRYGIIVGEGVASALRIRPGSPVTLVANSSGGALNTIDLEVVGVFQSYSQDFDARAVRVPLATAQELLATSGLNTLVLSLRSTADTDRAAAGLRQALDPAAYELKTWYQINDFYEKTAALFERQFGVLLAIVLVMVLLSVANTVNMAMYERTGEFGTLMALGNRPNEIMRLILVESCALGLIGASLGIVLGACLAFGISLLGIPMPPPPSSNLGYTARIRIDAGQLAIAFAIGWLATVGAALLPARRVAQVPVAEALRQNG